MVQYAGPISFILPIYSLLLSLTPVITDQDIEQLVSSFAWYKSK